MKRKNVRAIKYLKNVSPRYVWVIRALLPAKDTSGLADNSLYYSFPKRVLNPQSRLYDILIYPS